ncbi:hypothetical protein C0989_004274, partial [Termitomyces sp. Mn162]
SETFTYADEQAATYGFQFDKDYYGTSGPLQRCVPRYLDQVALPWIESIKSLGVKANPDPNAGDNTGVWITTATLDRNSVRSSAASAYYEPNQSRPNLKIICGAQATRIILSGKDTLVANGVEYLVDGVLHTINATKEVILSAGTYKTPQILELSGIGDPEVLKSFGIEVAVNLPGDHVTATFTAQLKPGHETFARLADAEFERMQKDLFKATGRGMLAGVPAAFAFLSFKDLDKDGSIANLVADLSLPTTPVSDVHKQWVCDNTVSFLDYGSVHISASEPTAVPAIDHNYLDNEIDVRILLKGYKLLREIYKTSPLKEHIVTEVNPGAEIQTDADLTEYIRRTLGTTFHPIGTASMLPRKDGGVVDSRLKVYGTQNLRVVGNFCALSFMLSLIFTSIRLTHLSSLFTSLPISKELSTPLQRR